MSGPITLTPSPSCIGRRVGCEGLRLILSLVFPEVFEQEIGLRGLVQRSHQLHRLVQKVDQVGKGVPEKAADTDSDVDSRVAQLGQGN